MITIGESLEYKMLKDFELERQECLSMMQKSKPGTELYERGKNRLVVVEQSVEGLRKAMANPLDYKNRLERGYSEEEMQRFEQFKQMAGNGGIKVCR